MDALEYGRRLTIDAFRPGADLSPTEEEVTDYLRELYTQLENARRDRSLLVISDETGLSGAITGAESNVSIHIFPSLGALTLKVLTRRDVLLSQLTGSLGARFDVGKFESHLSNVARAMPDEPERLRRVLMGDRSYARARLDDIWLRGR